MKVMKMIAVVRRITARSVSQDIGMREYLGSDVSLCKQNQQDEAEFWQNSK